MLKSIFFYKYLFFFLVVLSFLHHFWLDYGAYVILGMISVLFFFAAKGRERNSLEKRFLWMFLINIFGVFALSITHLDLLPEHVNQYGKSIGKLFFVAAVFFLLDAISFLIRKFGFDAVKFARFCLFGLFVAILLRISYVYISTPSASAIDIIWNDYQIAFLASGLNPNSADDLFIIHFSIVIFCLSILFSARKLDLVTWLVGILLGSYLLLSFVVTGSRGGQLGFVVASSFILLLFGLKRERIIFPAALLMLTCGLALNLNSLTPYLNKTVANQLAKNSNVKQYDYEEIKKAKAFVHQNPEYIQAVKRSEILQTCLPILEYDHQKNYPFVDASAAYRLAEWSNGVQIWLQRPLFGHGEFNRVRLVNDYDFLSRCHILSFSHIHSFYLDILIRGGVFMLLIFLTSFFYIFYILLKKIDLEDRSGVIGIAPIFYFIYLVVENFFDLTMIYHTQLIGYTLSFVVMCGVFLGLDHSKSQFRH